MLYNNDTIIHNRLHNILGSASVTCVCPFVRDKSLHTTTNKCLQCLLKNNVYSILNSWCICINLSCGFRPLLALAWPVTCRDSTV